MCENLRTQYLQGIVTPNLSYPNSPPSPSLTFKFSVVAAWALNHEALLGQSNEIIKFAIFISCLLSNRETPTYQNLHTFFFFCGAATQHGPWSPHSWGFWITHNDALRSVGLLWTSDQLIAETSTWQHTTLTTDKHPCPRWDSNPRSQQASGRRPAP